SEHLRTLDRYTTLAAQEIAARQNNVPISRVLFDPPWTFLQTYVVKLGFLDGVEGLAIAYMAAFYNFAKYTKARLMTPGRKL
ncbi:MAG: glycosyltransferase family 2 protein, partial [Acidobacteriota bacterium]|nr:glycosyltransferase family 2 protein [Acidobacteriota bacterium]MDQ2840935.1 glycosyltransferase family 2 protein [Acidobacteriota bacterium]